MGPRIAVRGAEYVFDVTCSNTYIRGPPPFIRNQTQESGLDPSAV